MNKKPAKIKIEPPFWWSDMKNGELQLLVYGTDIATYRPHIGYPGVRIKEVVAPGNPHYLLIYLDTGTARPGRFNILFEKEGDAFSVPYELKRREPNAAQVKGFDSSDVVYLILPDRFANGNPDNDQIPMRNAYKVDRKDPSARHGGDLAGIERHLNYLDALGVTAIWLNPVLENDMPGGSYHGYATTDYYRVDPRLGTNEDYLRLIDKAHRRGIRVIMDLIFNHCGSGHPWMEEPPSHDWFNHAERYIQTNHDKEALFDPYASDYDKERLIRGWFVPDMPDLNQRNPHVARYLIQSSIWWIEYAGIDGIRQDTYPYAEPEMMREWCKEVMNEYPDFNIVGEAWMNYTIGSAYWQKGSRLNFGEDTGLKSVMDFRLMGIAGQAFREKTGDSGGLHTIFEHLCYDYVYPDIYHVLRFLENHDTDRFLTTTPNSGEELYAFKQAVTFLLTIPGIPQLYYGQELLMSGTRAKDDGYVRQDMPGGWPDDETNGFEASGRSEVQNEAWNFLRRLLKWRKGNEVIARGKMKHFKPNRGVYVYERRLGDKSVLIFLNGNHQKVNLPLDRYAEVIQGKSSGKDILTGRRIVLKKRLTLAPKGIRVMEL